MTEKQADRIIDLLIGIKAELEQLNSAINDVESNTSSTAHEVSMLTYKFDEIKNAIEGN